VYSPSSIVDVFLMVSTILPTLMVTLYLVGRLTVPSIIKDDLFLLNVNCVVARVIVSSSHVNEVSCQSVPYFSKLLVLYSKVEPENQKKHVMSILK